MADGKKRQRPDVEDNRLSKCTKNAGAKQVLSTPTKSSGSKTEESDREQSSEHTSLDKEMLMSVVHAPVTTTDTQSNPTFLRQAGSTFAAVLRQDEQTDCNESKEKNGDDSGQQESTIVQIGASYKGPYLEDLDMFRVDKLPEICEVTDIDAQDEILLPGYIGLPALWQGSFKPWDGTPGQGHPMFSVYWPNVNPDIRIWNCVDAIQFAQSDRIINPSWVSPLLVNAKRSSPDGFKLRLHVGSKHAICVTSITVTDSYLESFPSAGLAQHQLRGVVHSQKWDRLIGFFCMVFHQTELSAQLYMDSIAFTTKATSNPRGNKDMYRPSRKTNVGQNTQATKKKPDVFLLEADDTVPVYDARDIDFDLSKDINNLESLTLCKGEIPKQSFAVVGYTASCYRSAKDGLWHFSANILWAIVMGCRKK